MERKQRLAEEFEIESEQQAVDDYAHVAGVISVNYSLMADELARLGDFSRGLALDVGTGLGDLAIEVAKRYPELQVIGVDISEQALEAARKKASAEKLNNLDFKLEDVHKFSFAEDSFDLVVSHGVLHHLNDLPRFFLEIQRILKPAAIAYLTDLRRDAPDDIVKEVEQDLTPASAKAFLNSVAAAYTPEELRALLAGLGIKNFEVSGQRFSKETIFKNIAKLRKVSNRKADYTTLSQVVIIRKYQEVEYGDSGTDFKTTPFF